MKAFAKKDFCTKKLLVTAWIIFSVPFIIWVLWSMMLQKAYNMGIRNGEMKVAEAELKGRVLAYSEVFQAANNEKCAPFPVNLKDKTVTLVNLSCLQGAIAPAKTDDTEKSTEEENN